MSSPATLAVAYAHLLEIVHNNLTNAADWTSVTTYTLHPRPLLIGSPPEPLYQASTREYVLPVGLREKWSPRKMAEVFDAIPSEPEEGEQEAEKKKKRLLLAVVGEDSTVVYYFVHDGIVKPRQN